MTAVHGSVPLPGVHWLLVRGVGGRSGKGARERSREHAAPLLSWKGAREQGSKQALAGAPFTGASCWKVRTIVLFDFPTGAC